MPRLGRQLKTTEQAEPSHGEAQRQDILLLAQHGACSFCPTRVSMLEPHCSDLLPLPRFRDDIREALQYEVGDGLEGCELIFAVAVSRVVSLGLCS